MTGMQAQAQVLRLTYYCGLYLFICVSYIAYLSPEATNKRRRQWRAHSIAARRSRGQEAYSSVVDGGRPTYSMPTSTRSVPARTSMRPLQVATPKTRLADGWELELQPPSLPAQSAGCCASGFGLITEDARLNANPDV